MIMVYTLQTFTGPRGKVIPGQIHTVADSVAQAWIQQGKAEVYDPGNIPSQPAMEPAKEQEPEENKLKEPAKPAKKYQTK